MIQQGTVLLLGAGASCPYGYPTGWQLRQEIIKNGLGYLEDHEIPPTTARKFVADFQTSGLYSIDSFLEKRPEFALPGKLCIARALLRHEERIVTAKDPAQDWYAYLWNKLSTPRFAELDLSCVAVVTFNYDRSLEHYLLRAICSSYGVGESLALDKLRALQIVHVYGSLGAPFDGQPDFMPQVRKVETHHVTKAAAHLHTIPDDRQDESRFEHCRGLLLKAETLCMLGFGFDDVNLKRLGAPLTLGPVFRDPDGRTQIRTRRVYATAYGLTNAERMAAAEKCNFLARDFTDGAHRLRHFLDMDCTSMLRETLALN